MRKDYSYKAVKESYRKDHEVEVVRLRKILRDKNQYSYPMRARHNNRLRVYVSKENNYE